VVRREERVRAVVDFPGSDLAVADVRAAAVVVMVAAVATADVAVKVAAGGIAFQTRIIANPHGSRASRAGKTLSRSRFSTIPLVLRSRVLVEL